MLVLGAWSASGCAASILTRPLEKGAREIHASLGGPLVKLGGVPAPIPVAQVGFRYGLSDSVAVGMDLPITLIALKNVAIDPHLTWFPARRLGLQAETVLVLDVSSGVFRAYPILSGWYRIPVSRGVALVPGLNAFAGGRAPRLLVSPSLGAAFGAGKWDLLVETMYLAANVKDTFGSIDYVSPGRGGVGLFVGVGRRFR